MFTNKNKAFSIWWWLLVLSYKFINVDAFGLLAKSDIMKCERYASSGDSKSSIKNCKNKILTTLTITNNNREPSGELRFTNWNVKTENGTELQLRFGMKLTITKGLTWNQYPLDKLQFFNFKPFELLVYTKSDECKDDPKQNDVTCNWAYNNVNGNLIRIDNSQYLPNRAPHGDVLGVVGEPFDGEGCVGLVSRRLDLRSESY